MSRPVDLFWETTVQSLLLPPRIVLQFAFHCRQLDFAASIAFGAAFAGHEEVSEFHSPPWKEADSSMVGLAE